MPDVLFIESKFKSSRRTEFTQSRGEWGRCLWSKDILKETVLCVVCVGRLNKKYMIVFADPFQSFTRTFDLMGNCSEERSGGVEVWRSGGGEEERGRVGYRKSLVNPLPAFLLCIYTDPSYVQGCVRFLLMRSCCKTSYCSMDKKAVKSTQQPQ